MGLRMRLLIARDPFKPSSRKYTIVSWNLNLIKSSSIGYMSELIGLEKASSRCH